MIIALMTEAVLAQYRRHGHHTNGQAMDMLTRSDTAAAYLVTAPDDLEKIVYAPYFFDDLGHSPGYGMRPTDR